MRFEFLETSLEAIRHLRRPGATLRRRDRRLYEQLRSAASSVPLNIAEGCRRAGKDRRHHWRVAAGSADELRTALRVAEAWGDLSPEECAPALQRIDSVLAMLWRLTG